MIAKSKFASLLLQLFLICGFAFAVPKEGAITGVVMDESGAVISRANVLILTADTHEAIRREHTTGDGAFHLALPKGKYQVQFSRSGFIPSLQNIVVQSGKTLTVSPVLQMEDQGSGSQFLPYFLQKLHVTDPTGADIPGASILLRQYSTDRGTVGFTNQQGEAVLNIPALDYQIEVAALAFRTSHLKKDLEASDDPLSVKLPVGECSPCVTVLDSDGNPIRPKPVVVSMNLSGIVIDTDLQPLTGVVVKVYRYGRKAPLTRAVTDTHGVYALHFETEDSYELRLRTPDFEPVVWNNLFDPKAEHLPTVQMQKASSPASR